MENLKNDIINKINEEIDDMEIFILISKYFQK